MRKIVLVTFLCVAGCSKPEAIEDPAFCRLKPGQRAVVISWKYSEAIMIKNPPIDGDAKGMADADYEFWILKSGDIVNCERDENAAQVVTVDQLDPSTPKDEIQGDRDFRSVKVLVVKGEHKGRVGFLPRTFLRPEK